MTVRSWDDSVRKRKVLTVFKTAKITGEWLRTFNDAIAKFNDLSQKSLNLGVTFSSPSNVQPPNPDGEGGAEVQFDLGNGQLKYRALGKDFVAEDDDGNPINFSPFELHGATQRVSERVGDGPARLKRAFIFVPETPMVNAMMRTGPGPNDFKPGRRLAGGGMRLYIAVHELVHACGISNAEHNQMGPDADVFTNLPTVSAGAFDKPDEDKFLLRVNHPNPPITAPPILIKKKVADLIRDNWK